MSTKFRKRPVVIEAIQVTDDNLTELLGMDRSDGALTVYCQTVGDAVTNRVAWVEIATLEGAMRAERGDWIITGVQGERYPCKPDIFAATYEPVEDGE